MAKELFPSSFECDCDHESHFFESTVREMKKMSEKKRTRLGDSSGKEEHIIVFHKGKAIEIICPKLGRCKI
ncbi:MAG: hypothetical protein J5I94_05175 [Phaeodactylibacter sp.]|nr:hypothetical protein [Phaeodactylibacter sp.]